MTCVQAGKALSAVSAVDVASRTWAQSDRGCLQPFKSLETLPGFPGARTAVSVISVTRTGGKYSMRRTGFWGVISSMARYLQTKQVEKLQILCCSNSLITLVHGTRVFKQ